MFKRALILWLVIGCAMAADADEDVIVGEEYTAPFGAGWVSVASAKTDVPHRAVIAKVRVRVLGLSEEFGALCVVLSTPVNSGTWARLGEHYWIDPAEILRWEPANLRQAATAARMKSEMARILGDPDA